MQPDSAKVELHALPRAAFNDGELNHNMAQGLCLQPARSAEDCFVKHQWPTNMLTTYSRTAALIPSRLCGQLGVHVITLADHQECPITKCYNHNKNAQNAHTHNFTLAHVADSPSRDGGAAWQSGSTSARIAHSGIQVEGKLQRPPVLLYRASKSPANANFLRVTRSM